MRTGILIMLGLVFSGAETALAARADHVLTGVRSQIVMRCEAPVEFSDRYVYAGPDIAALSGGDSGLRLTLLRHGNNQYDLLAGSDSMAATGRLLQTPGAANPVHLVFNTKSGPEHFLFVRNADGTAELLWSSATASALTPCSLVYGQIY